MELCSSELARVGESLSLPFQAVSNRTYSVQYCDDLGTGIWLKLSDVVARPTNWIETISDLAPNAQRLHRIATPQTQCKSSRWQFASLDVVNPSAFPYELLRFGVATSSR